MGKGKSAKQPKSKCCASKPRCRRCPVLMMKEGRLPSGYTVKKKRLVRLPAEPVAVGKGGAPA